MGFTPGTSKKRKKDAGAFGRGLRSFKVTKIEEDSPRIFRIVQGVVQTQTIFYPCVRQDKKTGQYKLGKQVVIRPPSGSLFDALVEEEREVYKELFGKGKAEYERKKPELSYSATYSYFAFDLNAGTHDSPKLIELICNKIVFNQINEMEKRPDPQDPAYLLHGLHFMYDVIVSVAIDPNKPDGINRVYTTAPYKNNPFEGKVPVEHLDLDEFPLDEETIADCFTDAEWKVIEESDLDLDTLHVPDTHDSIRDKLQKNPIFFGGPRSFEATKPAFPEPERLEAICEENEIPFLTTPQASKYLTTGDVSEKVDVEEDNKGVDIEEHYDDDTRTKEPEEVKEAKPVSRRRSKGASVKPPW